MSGEPLAEARAALRVRQGSGARYDAPNAPACLLDWARRGTAYFARILNGLSDADLDASSRMPGLTRRQLVAYVGHDARMLSEVVAWVRTRQSKPLPREARALPGEVASASTLPARALRYLFQHSAVHLDVEWRDLDDVAWGAVLNDPAGRRIAIVDTPEIRARTLWLHAIDLGAGGRFTDMPPEFIDAVIRHYATTEYWKGGFVLAPSDRMETVAVGDTAETIISGQAADIARWISGRGV